MARHDPAWTPDVDEAPTTHPKTREQLVQENRARREQEPAAAPQETDSESGASAAKVPPTPRTQPARTPAVNAAETGEHDVRIGPGDAGASDAPTHRTEPVAGRKDSWGRALGILGAAVLVALIVALLF